MSPCGAGSDTHHALIHILTGACTHIHIQIYTWRHTCTHRYMHAYPYRHTHPMQVFPWPRHFCDKHTCTHTHEHTLACRQTYTHTHRYTNVHMHTYSPQAGIHIDAQAHTCVHAHMCTYSPQACTHTEITHMHMHMHTYPKEQGSPDAIPSTHCQGSPIPWKPSCCTLAVSLPSQPWLQYHVYFLLLPAGVGALVLCPTFPGSEARPLLPKLSWAPPLMGCSPHLRLHFLVE